MGKCKRFYKKSGMTLIEGVVAIAIIGIIAIGGLSYYYYAVQHFRIAHADLTATRVGQLILEDWKSAGAENLENYDPNELGFGFVKHSDSQYSINIDNVPLDITLMPPETIETDKYAGTLRRLEVEVEWDSGRATDPILSFVTYARKGQD